ncbi:hypothetical protein [Actinacidiphila rubida]|uniref:Uncharacterized protein n=1 Tax=Actinacidiphila rubida TaxID=310780 RepID=A0A1H8SXA2_9ACTN|nr:hypothetical protein [Actinacidiphila rubida]SEO83619.1 hypothetical protein SAMN05216267_104655 [Actinacidiphila rubida]
MPASSIAPLISGWQRRVGGLPGPYSVAPASGVASGGTGVNGLMVELLIDGSWVDITKRVMVRDSNGQISITRGQTSEGQQPSPGTCSLQLNNRDGLFSPANPMSPYYGKIGRNTQLRVSVAKGDDKSYRFWGEVTGWPEDWDSTDTDVWVDIEAAGILRRLNQGSTPLRSTMYRGLTSMATTPPIAYWPCEDGTSATSLASALTGGQAMTFRGTPNLAADTGFLCSTALPTLNGASLVGVIPPYTVTGESQTRWLMWLPTSPPDGTQLIKIRSTGGTIPYWAVTYGTGGSLTVKGLDTDGLTVLVASGVMAFGVDGQRMRFSLELTQSGPNVNWTMGAVSAATGFNGQLSGTFNSQTVGRLTTITIAPGRTITDGVFGHVSFQNDVTSAFDLEGQVTAFVGESPSARIIRLCGEQGVNAVIITTASTDTMGPQLPGTFMALLQECVDVDQGIFFEREVAFGLAFRPRPALYNQVPRIVLSYPGNQLAQIPKPVPDDQLVHNSITASRQNGSSATAVLSQGPLSVLDPPNGVGTYPDNPTLNVQSDDDLPQHAAWRLHLGTIDEPRYPAISINLAHPSMAAQRVNALNVLFGMNIVVSSPPSRLGGDISQLVIGITETITHFEHRITYVCQPESPYEVFVLDDSARGKADTDGSVLAQDMTPTQTTVQVAVTAGPLWTTNPVDYPIQVMAAGELMTVTNITGASSPQTFTVTRSVNGVAKPHAAGEPISLANPTALAL